MEYKVSGIGVQTCKIEDEVGRCESVEEVRIVLNRILESQKRMWPEKINSILESFDGNQQEFADLCGVSRMTINKWKNGALPKKRETFLKIGMAAQFDRDYINQLLVRYGCYPELYSKSLEDLVCIYVIQKYSGKEIIEKYNYICKKVKDLLINSSGNGEENLITTQVLDQRISDVKNEDELEQMVSECYSAFSTAYNDLYTFVLGTINANYIECEYADTISEMAQYQEWSPSLRQCVREIEQGKWYPTRNKVISLGIHLSLDKDGINEMLEYARMEPLCAKNAFEAAIIYILDDALLNDKLNISSWNYDPDGLCIYTREVLTELGMEEFHEFLAELPEDDDDWK